MLQGNYAKEPFDLKLTVLRMLRQLPFLLGITLIGTLLFGGGYYVKNVLGAEKLYRAVSTFHIEYDVNAEVEVGTVHINETTWNTYMDTKLILNAIQERLDREEAGVEITNEELKQVSSAILASDLRAPSIEMVTDDPEKSLRLARAAEAALPNILPAAFREINGVHVIDPVDEATLVVEDVRVVNALILSAVLSCFFGAVVLLCKELSDESIWLPATIEYRYGVRCAGSMESAHLWENLRYFFEGKEKVALCTAAEGPNPFTILEELKAGAETQEVSFDGYFVAPSPAVCPESARALREADGILLVCQAGKGASKQLEFTLGYLKDQDCTVGAVLLYDADEWLIRRYYFGKKGN